VINGRHERVAVSITPLALEADSRAFKVAVSLRRFGYRSLVLEGAASAHDFSQFGLEVISLGKPSRRAGGSASKKGFLDPSRNFGFWGSLARLSVFYVGFFFRYFFVPFRYLPRAELYYVHSYEYLAVVLARRRRARIIYDAHDFYQEMVPKQNQSYFVRAFLLPAMARIERWTARRCDAVVTVSAGVAAALAETISVNATVIRNAVDSRNNRDAHASIREVLKLEPSDLLLVMIGNRKVGIDFDFVAAILRRLPSSFHFVFIGRGFELGNGVSHGIGADRRLHFLPAVPASEVSRFIASADAGLLLRRPISRNDHSALPNGFFHIIDAGLPLARLPLPEIEAVIGDRAVGPVLDAGDSERAARQILSFFDDSQTRARCAEEVAKLARNLDWSAQEPILRAVCEPNRSHH